VRAVIAESYERIHRSNLVGMGVVPLEFLPGESAAKLGLTGEEILETSGCRSCWRRARAPRRSPSAGAATASSGEFKVQVRIDTPRRPRTTSTAASCCTCCAQLLQAAAVDAEEPHRPRWFEVSRRDLGRLLSDHLHCERKAAENALSLVRRYAGSATLVAR
jgi:hypothetical protein